MANSWKILYRNKVFYDYFLEKKILQARPSLSEEELLARIEFLVRFSSRNHPGYYSDGRLENILLELGRGLAERIPAATARRLEQGIGLTDEPVAVLHVATRVWEAGGHTRIIHQFLKRHQGGKQLLLLTEQDAAEVPAWLVEENPEVTILSLAGIASPFERAHLLRKLAGRCHCVLLHHHPGDVVPVLAFAEPGLPSVAVDNHAHSWLWLGASVTDLVLCLSRFHTRFTARVRPVANCQWFPFTQIEDLEPEFDLQEKEAARRRLGVAPGRTCLIAIGTAEKFVPNSGYDFYRTAGKIMDKFPEVELHIVGIDDSVEVRKRYRLPERVRFAGVVADPGDYYRAADICLDALPQPSLGGTTYATLAGLACPLFKYGEVNMFYGLNLIDGKLYRKHVGDLRDESEFLEKLGVLIADPGLRLSIARDIREEYLEQYSRERLAGSIASALSRAATLTHAPRPIPDGPFFGDADSAEIAETSGLQELEAVFSHFSTYLDLREKMAVLLQLARIPRLFSGAAHYAAQVAAYKFQKRCGALGRLQREACR